MWRWEKEFCRAEKSECMEDGGIRNRIVIHVTSKYQTSFTLKTNTCKTSANPHCDWRQAQRSSGYQTRPLTIFRIERRTFRTKWRLRTPDPRHATPCPTSPSSCAPLGVGGRAPSRAQTCLKGVEIEGRVRDRLVAVNRWYEYLIYLMQCNHTLLHY